MAKPRAVIYSALGASSVEADGGRDLPALGGEDLGIALGGQTRDDGFAHADNLRLDRLNKAETQRLVATGENLGGLLGGDYAANIGDKTFSLDDALLKDACVVGGDGNIMPQINDGKTQGAARAKSDRGGDDEMGGEGAGCFGVHCIGEGKKGGAGNV